MIGLKIDFDYIFRFAKEADNFGFRQKKMFLQQVSLNFANLLLFINSKRAQSKFSIYIIDH